MNQKHTFGKWLKDRRDDLGLTQQEFATQLGVSRFSIIRFENDERKPSNITIRKISVVVRVDIPTIQKIVKGE